MLDSRFVEFVEFNGAEGETYVTFVEVTDANRESLERFIALGERARFEFDELEIREADPRIDEEIIELLSLYDTNGYMSGFAVSELSDEAISELDGLEMVDEADTLGDMLLDVFRLRSGFVR